MARVVFNLTNHYPNLQDRAPEEVEAFFRAAYPELTRFLHHRPDSFYRTYLLEARGDGKPARDRNGD